MPTYEEIEAKIIENRILANRKKEAMSGLAVPDTSTTTPTKPITEKTTTPTWTQNLGREAMGLHKILDPMFEPGYYAKSGLAHTEMVKGIVNRYGPLAKHAGGAFGGDPMESYRLGQHAVKMAKESPLQTVFDLLAVVGGAGLLGKIRTPVRAGTQKLMAAKARVTSRNLQRVAKLEGMPGEFVRVGDKPATRKLYYKDPELGWVEYATKKKAGKNLSTDLDVFITETTPTPPVKPKTSVRKQQQNVNEQLKTIDEKIVAIEEEKLIPTNRLNPIKTKALDQKILALGAQKKKILEESPLPGRILEGKTSLTKKSSNIELSIQKVTDALKEAKPVRRTQEALYAKERTARLAKLRGVQEITTGEKGFYAEKGQLKGELPRVEFESIRGKISQADIDNLFNKVKDADILTDWEKITAREGLSKMFGEYGGRVPTEGELALLDQVFPANFLEAIMAKRALWAKAKDAGLQLANIPRSVMASFDLSFGGRQGAFAAPKFRREFWTSWKKQFKEFGSEKTYQASRETLVKDPDFLFAKESNVPFTEVGKKMGLREEKFASQWAERIPLVGRGVRASGRAYTAFANRFRLDIFKAMVKDAEKMGFNPRKNRLMARAMGDFVGNATGRGSLGQFENAALVLNAMFFSPRLNMARIRTLNPVYYMKQPKGVRKQAITTALSAAGLATTILTLAKLGGGEVEEDPRSADFGKIKIGNTRIDMMAGYGQFIRGGAQLITGQYISTTTGRKVDLGEGYRPITRMDIILRQIESKEAPIASFATGLLRGKNWIGEDFNVMKEVGNRFVPMVVADVIDIAKDDPKLLGLAAPAVFGIGLMTYPQKPKFTTRLHAVR
jgi:hypothetical protein